MTSDGDSVNHLAINQKQIRKDIMTIAWPVLIEVLLGSLFGMIDMMMLGKMPNQEIASASVAAVGMTNQPLYLGLSLIQALNIGGTAMIARYYGAKKYHRMESVLKHVMIIAMVFFAIPLAILGFIFAKPILSLMGAEPIALQTGLNYFRIIMVGFVFQAWNFTITAALRGIGQTKIPMKNNVIANFFNVIGNYVLIYGAFGFPALGVVGAGISTACANLLALILTFSYLLSGKSVIPFDLKKKFVFKKNIMLNFVSIGLPSAGEQLVLRLGVMTFLRIVSGLGTDVYAAHQIALSVLSLSFSPGQAFAITASSLVGKSLGEKSSNKAVRYARTISRLGIIFSCVMGVVFFVFGRDIASLYTGSPIIIQNTVIALSIVALIQPFQAHQLILTGVLRGAGDTVWTLISTFLGILVVRVSLGYLFVEVLALGLAGAWYAVLIDQLIRWAIIFGRFKTGKWKHIKIR
ncbi:putative efflux protein, MATE family [Granulicatella balaenopterae]|uniref:Probable multidrug resistance protein NorM n=1 Tax=Granulicatella balaenopterae TaxID=137733 RepID=A0A1H9L470_9LACT|nr:MATE family efflux transporter [Granulicatella balaenopterae]SER06128.1 putative efflux protein, MATE family [Granulicatella balaenopterae]